MFQKWRQKIRAAEAAFRSGQYEEASALLRQDNLREFLPGKKLAEKLAVEMADCAQRQAARGDTAAGWRNLNAALELRGELAPVRQAREAMVAQSLAEVERLLAAGELEPAFSRLNKLELRHGETADVRVLRQVGTRLQQAKTAMLGGYFPAAASHLSAAAALRPDWRWFSALQEDCTLKGAEYRRLSAALHQALGAEQWSEVLTAADALLELAPHCPEAQAARRRAWATVALPAGARAQRHPAVGNPKNRDALRNDCVASDSIDARYLLWIDAVGGFLVCTGSDVVLGRSSPDGAADVPIVADLARRHAVVRRDGEAYLLEPVRATKLDGRPVAGIAALADGNVIELGDGVELRFRRPHPLSGTARLEFVSRHRTQPASDAVLLMGENCVLGPGWQNHVVCRPWEADVVLFRQGGELRCRPNREFTVDGQPAASSTPLPAGSHVEGEDFSFSLESV